MSYSHALAEPDLFCYQLSYWMPYDPEAVWALVQQHQGHISVLNGGIYDYYINADYRSLLVMAFPLLRRQPQKDLYI